MKAAIITVLSCFVLSLSACEKHPSPLEQEEPQEEQKQSENSNQHENMQSMTMNITADGKTITATLADNATARALA